MKNLGFREKIIAGAALLVIVVTGWYFFFYSSTAAEIENNRAEIQRLRYEIENTDIDSVAIDSLKMQIHALEERSRRNENLIVPVDSVTFVSNMLIMKCREHNLQITQPVQMDKETLFGITEVDTSNTGIKKVPVFLYLRGTFFDLGYFLEELPGLPFLVRAGEIEIDTGDEIYPELEVSLTVYVFFRESM
ncbi:hypothetical protein ACFL6I_07805 [candidate division KSB1 bacterium]